jgi:hypothetical protein
MHTLELSSQKSLDMGVVFVTMTREHKEHFVTGKDVIHDSHQCNSMLASIFLTGVRCRVQRSYSVPILGIDGLFLWVTQFGMMNPIYQIEK